MPSAPSADAFRVCLGELDALLRQRPDARRHELALKRACKVMDRFHTLARQAGAAATHRDAVAAGCRLCADLSEHLHQGLMEAHLDSNAAIEQLSAALRRQLQARAQRARLLQRVQHMRQATSLQGEAVGLGVIL